MAHASSLDVCPVQAEPLDPWQHAARNVLLELFGPPAERTFAVRLWDGTTVPPGQQEAPFTLVVRRPGALRRMLLPPSELSLVEAYLHDDIDIEGDAEAAVSLSDGVAARLRSPARLARIARAVLALPAHDAPLLPERRRGSLIRFGRRHAKRRDAEAVRFHYDAGNDFYRLWLDQRMIYSCGYFAGDDDTLDSAQTAKLEHICRKLRLRPGERLLDVGCGWGGLVRYAAERFGVEAVGITLSGQQAELATARLRESSAGARCRIEIRDYRDLPAGESFDKIVSVGMVEHVGAGMLPTYFSTLHRLLRPGGLFLNHGIVSLERARRRGLSWQIAQRLWRRDAFLDRYVFPDGRLVPAAEVIAAAEGAGFETRDVESLREHYVRTLRAWVRRLERRHEEAVHLVGEAAYRVWRLYMAGSAYGFAHASIGIIQTVLAKPDAAGQSGLPATRADLYQPPMAARLQLGRSA